MVKQIEVPHRLLFSRKEAREMLGVGEKKFKTLGIDWIMVGKTKKYTLEDLQAFIERNKQGQVTVCQLKNGKAPSSIGTTSRCAVIGFEEALKRTTLQRQRQ